MTCSICNYVQVCHYEQVCVSICRYVDRTYPELPEDICTDIHTIPAHSDIPTNTCNTYLYMQYLHLVTYPYIPAIPTHTWLYLHITVYTCLYMQIHAHACIYLSVSRFFFILLVSGDLRWTEYTHTIHAHTCIYLRIPAYTCVYHLIPTDTCTYMHIHAIPTQNLKRPYLGNQWSVWHEPKNSINNHQWPTNCAGLWHFLPIRYHMTAYWKLSKRAIFGAPEQSIQFQHTPMHPVQCVFATPYIHSPPCNWILASLPVWRHYYRE